MQPDGQLLRAYAAGSEAAFNDLVSRYADLVYSAALRQVGNPELARDVSQQVFIDLARKATRLSDRVVLAGWLYRSTRYAALCVLRQEGRRRRREQLAMSTPETRPDAAWDWERLRPVLDEVVNALSSRDREAVLLRFFQNEDLRTIGSRLGLSEKAAQKRVARALDKLRSLLARRGVDTSAALLSMALSANAVQSAPVGLAATLAAKGCAGASAAGAAGSYDLWNYFRLMASTKTKTATLALVLAATAGTPWLWQQRALARLRAENALLRGQTAQLSELDRLRAENARLGRVQLDADELARLRAQQNEVLRLRGQVTALADQLRLITNAAAPPAQTNAPTAAPQVGLGQQALTASFGDRGQHSPEAALETLIWAAQKQPEKLAELVLMPEEFKQSPDKLAALVNDLGRQLNAAQQRVFSLRLQNLQYYGAYGVENPDGTSTIYKDVVQVQYGLTGWKERPEDDITYPRQLRFTLVDGKWKLLFEHWSPSNLKPAPPKSSGS